MGGAVATWAASSGAIKGLAGVIVVDVVEGTALGQRACLRAPACACVCLCFCPCAFASVFVHAWGRHRGGHGGGHQARSARVFARTYLHVCSSKCVRVRAILPASSQAKNDVMDVRKFDAQR